MAATLNTFSGIDLVRRGVVDTATVQKALEIQQKEAIKQRRKIGDILVSDFGVDRHTIYKEIASVYGFKECDLDRYALTEHQSSFIKSLIEKLEKKSRSYIIEHHILPFRVSPVKKDVLIVLAADPTDRNIPDLVVQFGYNKYDVYYSRRESLERIIQEVAPPANEFLQILDEMSLEFEAPEEVREEQSIDEEGLDAEIHKSKLTNLVEAALMEAVRQKASDIHLIPLEGNRVDFRFRIDGRLRTWHIQDNTRPEAIAAVLKDRAKNVDRFERETAQDGFIQRMIDDYTIRYRVSLLPIVGAEFERKLESVVIRVLDDRKVITDLEELGLQERARQDFQKAISKPQGIVILTGPTGSGKSTTLVAALHHIMDPSLCVLTVEDPVEYLIRGARQLKIGPKMNFDQAMRSILRHDPDIVLVGEMRDTKTAEIAIKLANTGHLTFSTLHTNDAPSAISRLYKMGIEPFLIANAINIVVSQRLIRTLCPSCKRPAQDLNPNFARSLGFTDEEIRRTVFYEAVGCKECNMGYKGRVAIHEALLFTKQIRQLIFDAHDNINEAAIRDAAVRDGMLTLRMSGKERIRQGVTSCEEIAFATAED